MSFYPSQVGGPTNSLKWHCKNLNESGNNITVITTSHGINENSIKFDLWLNSDYGKIIYIKTKFHKFSLKFIYNVLRKLKENHIIHFSSLFYPPTIPLLFFSILFNKEVIISPRGELFSAAINNKRILKIGLVKLIRLFSNKIYFHSTSEKESILINSFFPLRKGIFNIPNLIELKSQLNTNIKYKFDNKNLLFLGRISRIKSIESLLYAIKIIKDKHSLTLYLRIAGKAFRSDDKNYKKDLLKIIEKLNIKEQVSWLGHLEKDQKNNEIDKAFCLILPSKSENFGNVIVESLIQSTPVIASYGTPWSILNDYKCGKHTSNSPKSLANSIMEIINLNLDEYSEMCKNSYRCVSDNFDINKRKKDWQEIYNSISPS